jgi:hypothetical protein
VRCGCLATAGWVTPPIIFWFSEPRTSSERSSLSVLLIPAVMRPAVMAESIVVDHNYLGGVIAEVNKYQ